MFSGIPLLIVSKEQLNYDVEEQIKPFETAVETPQFVTGTYKRQGGKPFSPKSLPNLVIIEKFCLKATVLRASENSLRHRFFYSPVLIDRKPTVSP